VEITWVVEGEPPPPTPPPTPPLLRCRMSAYFLPNTHHTTPHPPRRTPHRSFVFTIQNFVNTQLKQLITQNSNNSESNSPLESYEVSDLLNILSHLDVIFDAIINTLGPPPPSPPSPPPPPPPQTPPSPYHLISPSASFNEIFQVSERSLGLCID